MTDSIPLGFCQCGCGQRTRISDRTHNRYGYVKGQPRLFVKGHCSHRPGRSPYATIEPPNPSGLCMCGCGLPTKIAPKTVSRLGWVKGHARPFVKGHRLGQRSRTEITDADYQVEDRGYSSPCWIVPLATHPDGHVSLKMRGERKARKAHRIMWEQKRGPIPQAHDVHHLCEQPPCVNPDHLQLLTHHDHARVHHGRSTR